MSSKRQRSWKICGFVTFEEKSLPVLEQTMAALFMQLESYVKNSNTSKQASLFSKILKYSGKNTEGYTEKLLYNVLFISDSTLNNLSLFKKLFKYN